MADKKEQTQAGATELSEEELGEVQGGFTAPGDVAGLKQGKKVNKPEAKGVLSSLQTG